MDLEAFLDLDVFVHLFILVVAVIIARAWYRAWRNGAKWENLPLDERRPNLVNPASGAPMVSEGFDALGNGMGWDDGIRHND